MNEQNRISNSTRRSLTPLCGLSAKLLVVPILSGAISASHASVVAYDGFGDGVNNTTLNGYDGTSAESGFSGAWVSSGGAANTVTPPVFGNQVGILGGVTPDSTGGAEHVLRKAGFNVGTYTRALTIGTINLTVDGTYYMSFFAAASGFDFVSQVGFSNATHELMAGQAYNGNRGLTAYFGANGTGVATNVANINLNGFNWADRNAFFTVQFTKTNSGTTNDVAITINAYDLGNVSDFDIGGGPQRTRTINLTGVSAVFDRLKVKLDGTVEFDEIRLGQSLLDVTTGGTNPDSDADGLLDVWEQQIINANPGDAIATFADVLAGDDFDGDQILNGEEFTLGTSPIDTDTDDDGVNDGLEVSGAGNLYNGAPTAPLDSDSDDDGISDGAESNGSLNTFNGEETNPNAADTDGDGFSDSTEFLYLTNANDFGSVPALYELIGLDKRNGSFELINGVVNGAKADHWDTATVGNVDSWTIWTEQSTASNDSGTEGGAFTHGAKSGYLQNGNAARNMTTYASKAGDIIRLTYDRTTAGNLTAYLIIDASDLSLGHIQIPTSTGQLTNSTGAKELIFTVPAGNLAIGRPLGVAFKSTGGWEKVDSVRLKVEDVDSEPDGLSDFVEDQYFGNNDGNPTSSELITQTGSDDSDGDTHSNADEVAAGSNPALASSVPGDTDGDGLGDAWETAFFGGLSNPNGAPGLDPDGDKDTNLVEFTNDTIPTDKFSFYSSTEDSVPDSWKTHYGIALSVTGLDNSDGDDLINVDEFTLGTNPVVADTDNDGLNDSEEVNTSETDPLDADSDNDELEDGEEVDDYQTDPNDVDSDDDGYRDNVEVIATSNPNLAASTPVTITGATVLIDTLHNNGSFEFLGGVTTNAAKASHWDTDPDGDVDHWKDWSAAVSGPSTAQDNSGSESVPNDASAGVRVGYLQANNAAYNRTSHIIAQGEVYTYTWDWVLPNRGSATAQLAYWDPAANGGTGGAIAIAGTATTNANTTAKNLGLGTTWTVPALDPAIGKEIVITIATTGNFPEVDNFVLSVVPGSGGNDTDADGLDDTWEATYGLIVGANDSAADLDKDGTDNLTEFRLGLIPNSGSSRFAATIAPNRQISWPSAVGVTFKIERSTTLSGWSTLEAAFAGTAGTATYTDPAPPVGKAFYKVTLNP